MSHGEHNFFGHTQFPVVDSSHHHIQVNAYGYQNAIQAGTYTGAQTGDMKAAAEKFCIGFAGPASVEWAGEITGIKIYNKALTQAEVLQNYNDQKERFGL